jgi:tRNA(Ile)-lysidine synthetase-like protein
MARPDDHYHPLVRQVARALRQRCGVAAGSAIVVATSGGADSVALLRVLSMLAQRRKWRLCLIVGHVQHHLREEAEADAEFVQALANELGLPFARRDIRPGDVSGNMEANARRLRYAALSEIACEHDAGFIATAHHADDQLETLLMRMLRGASVAGLRGIAWQKTRENDQGTEMQIIRPMLAIGQEDITALLDRLDQPYREDATNYDTDRTRARLRHDVLPVLKAIQGDAVQKAGALVEHFGDLYELLQSSAAQASSRSGRASSGFALPRDQARAMNRAVLAEVLRHALIEAGVAPGRLTRNALLPAVAAAQDTTGGTRTFTFANDVSLQIAREMITLASPDSRLG